ncbi:MAG: uncharacterized membrane protein YhaH (DUF805 family) [Paracoccaceae bacterium]|jgi:uncharacterized membrane protein YhaH (DUF805 family)
MDFGEAISVCFKKYATFSGRARRSEFWYFILFYFIGTLVLGFADGAIMAVSGGGLSPLGLIFAIVMILPAISAQVRRLHDIGRTGWWWWISLIPGIGPIVLLVFACLESEPVDNRFGPAV